MAYDDGEEVEWEEDMEESDLWMLRQDLSEELEAINRYQDHIDTLENEEARQVLERIRDHAKEHVANLVKLIKMLDATQAEKFREEGLWS